MTIIDKIFENQLLKDNPPVLVDVGASGELNKDWKEIAPYSICIAFDADNREVAYIEEESSQYKKLYIFNSIVSDNEEKEKTFYLTKSPFCSSSLKPNNIKLKKWIFSELFEVEKEVKLKTITLKNVLQELKIKKIDWFKIDSQGTDLRIFKSLGKEHIKSIILTDFEPGILDAYQDEDKLYKVVEFMENNPFWMSNINICKTKRVNLENLKKHFPDEEIEKIIKKTVQTPGWGEISFMNTFENNKNLDKRDFLLGIAFAFLKKQYSHALEIAFNGYEQFKDDFFNIITRDLKEILIKKEKVFKRRIKKIFKLISLFIPPIITNTLKKIWKK